MGWLKLSILSWLGLLCVALYTSGKMVTCALFFTGVAAIAILDYIKRDYWRKLGIATADDSLPILGNILMIMDTKSFGWEPLHKVYEKYKESRYAGWYFLWSPNLLLTDPEIVKQVAIKDFDHFTDRRPFIIEGKDKYVNDMLTMAGGAHWKGMRSVLTPTFSSGKMKNMFPLVMAKADTLMKKFHTITGNGEATVDMKNYIGRITLDVISTCAFGFESNCIVDEAAEFEKRMAVAADIGVEIVFRGLINSFAPKVAGYFDLTVFKQWRFFKDLCVKVIEERRNTKVKRGDFVDLALEAQAAQAEPGSTKHDFTDDAMIAASVIFLLAGYDTVLTTLIVSSYMLAHHQEEQEKLRQELCEIVDEHGCLNYQNVMEAKYLEAIIFESQRINPAALLLERQCTKDYVLPGTNIKIEKGQMVGIPVWSLQNDERYWKEPKNFNPDRFLPENKGDIIPGTYMPFGIGPRSCIAMRFAQMELKIILAKLVQEFQLSPAPGSKEIPLKKGMIVRPLDTVPFNLTPITPRPEE